MSDYRITFYKGTGKVPAPFKNILLVGSVEQIDNYFTTPPVIGSSYQMSSTHRIAPDGLFMSDLDIRQMYGFTYAIVENIGEIPYFCYVKNPTYKNASTLVTLEIDVVNTFFRRDAISDYDGVQTRCRVLAKHRSIYDTAFSQNVPADKKDKSRVLRALKYSDNISDTNKTRYAIVIAKVPLTDKLYGMFAGTSNMPTFINVLAPGYTPAEDLATLLTPTMSNGVNTGVYAYVVPFSTTISTAAANWYNTKCYNYNEPFKALEYKGASGLLVLSSLLEDPNVVDIYVTNKVNDDIAITSGLPPADGKVGIGVANAPDGIGKGVPLYIEVGKDADIGYGACMFISDTKYLEDTVFDTTVEDILSPVDYTFDGARNVLKNAGNVQLMLNDNYAIDPRYLAAKGDKTELYIKRKKVIDGASLKEIYFVYRYKSYVAPYDTKSAHVDDDLARLVLKTDAWQSYAVNNKVQLRSGFIVQTALSAAGSIMSGNYGGAALGTAGTVANEFINRANLKAVPDEIRNNGSALFQFALTECRPVIKVYTYTDDVEAEAITEYKLTGEAYDVPVMQTLSDVMKLPTRYCFYVKFDAVDPITEAPPEYAEQLLDVLRSGIRVYVVGNMPVNSNLTAWVNDNNYLEG